MPTPELVKELAFLGALAGAGYAMFGVGLVLIYRTNRVINFAHGAIGALAAYLDWTVADQVGPWVGLLIAIAAAACLGAAIQVIIMRRIRGELEQTVATLGIVIAITAIVLLQWGDQPRTLPQLLGDHRVSIWDVSLSWNVLSIGIVAAVLAAALYLFFRRTHLGMAMEAASLEPTGAQLSGVDTGQMATISWALASGLAALAAVLLAQRFSLDPGSLTTFTIVALAPAFLAGLRSFPVVFVGGVAYGLLDYELTGFANENVNTLRLSLPFLVVILALLLGSVGAVAGQRETVVQARPAVPVPPRIGSSPIWQTAIFPLLVFLGLLVYPLFASGYWAYVGTLALIWALMGLSLSLLAGWSGQISLAHGAFWGMGAWATGSLMENWGVPAIPSYAAGALIGVPLSLAIGLPALRVRGLYLAVTTLAFMMFMERAAFPRLVGKYEIPLAIGRPQLGPLDFADDRLFYYLVLSVTALLFLGAWLLGRSVFKRSLVAVSNSEQAFSSVGGSVIAQKLLAFMISGGVASLAGVLWGLSQGQVSRVDLTLNMSLFFLIIAVVGGRGSIMGAGLAAGLFAVWPEVYRDIPDVQNYSYLVSGVFLVLTLVSAPGGLASVPGEASRLARHLLRRQNLAEGRLPTAEAVTAPGAGAGEAGSEAPIPRGIPSKPHRAWQGPHPLRRVETDHEETLLRVADVSMRFGGLEALRKVSFSVPSGAVVGLVGPNGAGKTTLFNCINGFYHHSGGSIFYQGEDISHWPPRRRAMAGIARTFQTPNVFQDLTAEENVIIADHIRGSSGIIASLVRSIGRTSPGGRRTAHLLLEIVGLEDRALTPASALPHASAKLLELARALAIRPRLLLLDEPAGGLDRSEAEAFGQILEVLRDDFGATVLVVEHDVQWVMRFCERIIVLDQGIVLAEGTPAEIAAHPGVVAAYLGEEGLRAGSQRS